jgi:S-adenosylmethionine hydrolase
MPRPLITLTTDFGTADHFVAAMKGVILTIHPTARIVDITHEVPPFSVLEGAFLLDEGARWFPRGTIHVAVVDPGVGSARRPILVEAGGHLYVGPDNGIFSMVRRRAASSRAREITNRKLMLPSVSNTFHGRDIFAPVAAHLAKGVTPAKVGKLIPDALLLRAAVPEQTNKRTWTGTILHVDQFGNLITSFGPDEASRLRDRPFELTAGFETIRHWAAFYADQPFGQLFAIKGSSGFIEICMNQASAAKKLGCAAGAPVELTIF